MAFMLQALKLPPVPEAEEIIDSMSSDLFSFAVTRKAVYLTTNKDVARFPLSAIRRVALEPARGLSGSMILNSLPFPIFLMTTFVYSTKIGQLSHVLVGILFLSPFVSMVRGYRGRYRLWIDLSPDFAASSNEFEPPPEAVASPGKKAAALEAQTRFLDACRRVGLWVADSRLPAGSSG